MTLIFEAISSKKQEIEVEPPKGNFTVIAVCGLSGALLGPPNFHSYQKNLMDLHQRKFSRMHIDGYKRKIQMVRDEETIEKWTWKEPMEKGGSVVRHLVPRYVMIANLA